MNDSVFLGIRGPCPTYCICTTSDFVTVFRQLVYIPNMIFFKILVLLILDTVSLIALCY